MADGMNGPGSSGAPDAGWQPEVALRRRNLAFLRAVGELRGRSGRVLEVGAGTARFLRGLREEFPEIEAHACDMEHDGLVLGQKSDGSLRPVQGDLTALPYRDGSFQAVLVFDVFEHLYRPEDGIGEVWRVLAPGGVLHALVPCEGHPLTLHWLLWKTNIGADIKRRSVGHVQRFTHGHLAGLLHAAGFRVQRTSYSMHPIGQVKDILLHLQQLGDLPGWLARNPLYRAVSVALWGGAYLESSLLARIPISAVAVHVTATKPLEDGAAECGS